MKNLKTITFTLLFSVVYIQAQDIKLLKTDVFEKSGLEGLNDDSFGFTMDFSPTNSYWFVSDYFPESMVFKSEMKYASSSNPDLSYQLRIGKGGQIYSFRGSFGESIPPQYRNENTVPNTYGGGAAYAPWIDEVWQMVGVSTALNDRDNNRKYYIHQSGVYLKTEQQTEPFYSPFVAEYYNEDEQSYTIVNWGQQAHTNDNLTAGFRSDILYYTKYSNVGNGIIQVDNMVYNFGQDEIDFLNMPWGGVRVSSLEYFFVSNPDNSYNSVFGAFGELPALKTAETGGWFAFSNASSGNGPTLGMVHCRDELDSKALYRYGYAGGNVESLRDYNVFSMIRQPNDHNLDFGKAMQFRYFFVLGSSVDDVRYAISKYELNTLTYEKKYQLTSEETAKVHYLLNLWDGIITAEPYDEGFKLSAVPFLGSYPVFLISSSDGDNMISSNQYHFSILPYDGKLKGIQLLGFREKPCNVAIINDEIKSGESYVFPDGYVQSNISESLSYTCIIPSNVANYDSVVVSNIKVSAATGNSNLNHRGVKPKISLDNTGANKLLSVDFDTIRGKVYLDIYSINGKLIESASFSNTNSIQKLINVVNGIYIIRLKDRHSIYVQKIVVGLNSN